MKKFIFAQGNVSNNYITAGKRYLIVRELDHGLAFEFIDDNLQVTYSTWKNSSHQNGGDWVRSEKVL